MRLVAVLLCLLAAWPAAAERRAPDTLQLAGLHVAVWLPAPTTPGPWPVVVFSHGFKGCGTQSTFLTDGLSDAGYAVFAPDHRDAACHAPLKLLALPDAPFNDAAAWSAATYADRGADIRRLLDALQADPSFGPRLDWGRVALIGHSLGGYTVLGLAGAWPGWRDARVRAVIAMSPFITPFLRQHTLGGLAAAVMYQGGTHDFGISPTVARRDGGYDQTPRPKAYVSFDGAAHLAWTDFPGPYQDAIVAYAAAFLDHALKARRWPKPLAGRHRGVAELRLAE